ncbi:hypothetical protein [Frankia sp. ACN1ag]|uniref:hypothetical protein n=1 Tax=Frankia sp. ACN1ag TaxID=102891 RepID=UPI00128F8808|nr:hypothetical protein [Frankia sp. ACN1ag]
MDIRIPGLTRPQAHTLVRITTTLVEADGEVGTTPRRALHPRTLATLVRADLAWAHGPSAGPTPAGMATVTAALAALLGGEQLAPIRRRADETWLPQTVGISLHPVYSGWGVDVRSGAMARPRGCYGPYLTVLPTRYHVR